MSNDSHGVTAVAIVGAGQMGGGIAQVAAQAGFRTIVYDSHGGAIERCQANHRRLMDRAVEKGRISGEDAEAALARITYVGEIRDTMEADIIVEAVSEDASLKKQVFASLSAMSHGAGVHGAGVVLASNTSSISITELAASTDIPDRVIGMHFFYPVPVMRLVEVVEGLLTCPTVTARVMALSEAMGKVAIPAKDRAGFVSNRILMPMINEAFHAWMEGVATPEAIDQIMHLGCNMPMGPLRLADFIGLDTCAHIMDVLAEGLNDDRYRPCPLLRQLVTAGRLGDKTGRGVFEHTG